MAAPLTPAVHGSRLFTKLPPEIRLIIHEYAAQGHQQIPMAGRDWRHKYDHNKRLSEAHPDEDCQTCRSRRENLASLRSHTSWLRVCKQVRSEALPVFTQHHIWDVSSLWTQSHPHYERIHRRMQNMEVDTRHIQHISVEVDLGLVLLFSSRTPTDCPLRHCKSCYGIEQIRNALGNIRTIMIAWENLFDQTVALRVLKALAEPIDRAVLEKYFPRLEDIRCTNLYGSERFLKKRNGWQTAYTGKRIPLRRWRWKLLVEGVGHNGWPPMTDRRTRLTTAQCISCLGPSPPKEQTGEVESEGSSLGFSSSTIPGLSQQMLNLGIAEP